MTGQKFTAQPSGKEYLIIEKHKVFNDVYRCVPTYKLVGPPYKGNLIQCFSTDFIEECLNQQDDNTAITN
jgi:hypothetical protein